MAESKRQRDAVPQDSVEILIGPVPATAGPDAAACAECVSSCQSACKTSCTVGNQACTAPDPNTGRAGSTGA